MTRQTRVRLFSLLVLLGVLAGILVTPAEQNAYAAPCCSSCDLRYEGCLVGTYYAYCNCDPVCCDAAVANCYSWCNSGC